jgi:hypothetical protein
VSVRFCERLNLFKRLTSFFCNSEKLSHQYRLRGAIHFLPQIAPFQALAAPFASEPTRLDASELANGSHAIDAPSPGLARNSSVRTAWNKRRTELLNWQENVEFLWERVGGIRYALVGTG